MFREHPICLIWGMADWLFGRRCLERWQLYYPHAATLRLEDAGRYLLEDEPERPIAFMKEFFASNGI
jgi:pimeloyl-ACP methyl ester carboxylesterase